MHVPSEVTIGKGNVVFFAKHELCWRFQTQDRAEYWFHDLESAVGNIFHTIPNHDGTCVELYGVPERMRLYVKVLPRYEPIFQQEWELKFKGGVMWLSRLS